MRIIQIDVVRAESFEARKRVPTDVLGLGVDGQRSVGDLERMAFDMWWHAIAELAGDDHLVTPAGDRGTDQSFVVGIRPVPVRGVEERRPDINRMHQSPARQIVVDRRIQAGRQHHRAEAHGGYRQRAQ